jgi:hypothetical protein
MRLTRDCVTPIVVASCLLSAMPATGRTQAVARDSAMQWQQQATALFQQQTVAGYDFRDDVMARCPVDLPPTRRRWTRRFGAARTWIGAPCVARDRGF